jgi:hypothetical protein
METMTDNQTIPINLLDPHPANYNQHPPKQIKRLQASLRKFGQPRSIVVQAQDTGRFLIVAGHGVTLAARAEKWTALRCDVIPADWPQERVKAYLAADNELGRMAEPDNAALAAILEEARGFDAELLEAMGYGEEEFEALLREVGIGGEPEDADPDAQIQDFPVADLLAPYPYFGGKRGIAGAVWARFGQVDNYVEPFFGSGAMLLSRPEVQGLETVNDLDGFVANFWRAVAADPEAVAHHVDWPVNENDLFARHLWLVKQGASLTERLHSDPDHYDAKIAGWWCWGACNWIGTGWCSGEGPWRTDGETVEKGDAGQGVNRKLPHLGDAGQGVNRQLPHLGNAGRGGIDGQCADWSAHLFQMMGALPDRLRRTRVTCGDWERVSKSSVTDRHGLTAVFLDPPYAAGAMEYSVGGNQDDSLTRAVQGWAIENGGNEQLRIALCGYDPLPLTMPAGWVALRWTARKGYQNAENAKNSSREIVWFSPHCLKPVQDG